MTERAIRTRRRGATAIGCSALILVLAALVLDGCGERASRDREFDNAVASYLQGPLYLDSVGTRGPLETVRCDTPRRFPGGQLVGCAVTFARSGAERWFVIATDSFYVLPCPRRPSPLAALVGTVCRGTP